MMDRKLNNSELGRMNIASFKNSSNTNICVLLDNVRSLHNVGSVFRTCDAFLVNTLYLCGYTGCPPHKEIQKTALGATESVNWKHEKEITDCIQNLKKEGYLVVSVEQTENSVPLKEMKLNPGAKYALIFGNEVNGVSQEVVNQSDFCLEIDQGGTKHSLNIAVSAGIVLWEFYKNLGK